MSVTVKTPKKFDNIIKKAEELDKFEDSCNEILYKTGMIKTLADRIHKDSLRKIVEKYQVKGKISKDCEKNHRMRK
jgi:hypothetical protein